MSELRPFRTKKDKNASRVLLFAKHWHGQKFLFLTLTFTKDVSNCVRKLEFLLRHLRKKQSLEYFCVRTTEGNGAVFHLGLISKFIPYLKIRELWRKLTGAWNISVSYERNFKGLVGELTGQYGVARYSYSKGLIPTGTIAHLDWIKKNLAFCNRFKGYKMFCIRLKKHGDPYLAREETVSCLEKITGRCSSLYTEKEVSFRTV
jgi:hypothetical protein